jgi:two-component system cell cycle response regulator
MGRNVLVVSDEQDAGEKEQFLEKLHDCLAGYIHYRDLHVDLLARRMYMSRSTLFRKIKRMTGLTPNELILGFRLQKAAELLTAGRYRAFEVATMVGYTSQSSFGKSFLKHFKVTPATYQRMRKMLVPDK